MARPKKEGLGYFPMDTELDDKFKIIESIHKNDGFVWIVKFWQAAYSNNNGVVDLNGLRGVFHAENCRITPEKQGAIIKDCIEIGLINEIETGIYTSDGIQRRLNSIIKNRKNDQKRKHLELSDSFPDIIHTENPRKTGEREREREREIKENTGKKPARSFVKPSLEEVRGYCLERKNAVDAQRWFDYYESNGWRVGKNAMKDWRAAVQTWERNNFQQTSTTPSTGWKV